MVDGLEIKFIDNSTPKQTELIGYVFNAKEITNDWWKYWRLVVKNGY